ncbi:ubiquitin thioesterase OTU1 isoform X2 [Anoplophora glabripennis]|nr:ubiquitin thioesterase OTU1 isoform X1 [Anoplophora glabripennis]XP_023310184.1 ubiquitin thioesterase OTU1 isoform X2 [Anoplophora glabripennis]
MAGFALRIKTKSGQQVVNSLTKESTIKELKQVLSSLSNIPINRLHILSGFPPKILDITQDNLNLASSGITSGDTLILEERSAPVPVPKEVDVEQIQENKTRKHVEDPFDCPGILMKNVVPADNSCLFTSVHFVLNGKVDESGNVAPYMRQLVAETIRAAKDQYDEAILGKPIDEYCAWIQDDKSWGGAIELAILSNYYGMEIAVVDTINAIINRFGEDQSYPHRVFLMFDGIHYDPLYMESLDGGKIQTIFSSEDDRVLREAEQLAQEAKSSRQFTDVDKFSLKCMICNILLKGQVAAQQHAQTTGHANFGEV